MLVKLLIDMILKTNLVDGSPCSQAWRSRRDVAWFPQLVGDGFVGIDDVHVLLHLHTLPAARMGDKLVHVDRTWS